MLGKFGQVTLAIRDLSVWRLKTHEYKRYESMYSNNGVVLFEGNVFSAISSDKFDLLIFEFYHSTIAFFDIACYLQPQALHIVDSVDVHFNRLQAKAALTRNVCDQDEAEQIRSEEFNAYQKADYELEMFQGLLRQINIAHHRLLSFEQQTIKQRIGLILWELLNKLKS